MDLMARRRVLMRDPVLPPIYHRVEYLQSSGQQYILTNFTNPYGYETDIETLDGATPENSLGYLGWWNSASQNDMQSVWLKTDNKIHNAVAYGKNNTSYILPTPYNGVIKIDGLNISAGSTSHTASALPPDIGVKFALFGYNRTTGVVNCAGKCRIRYARFWNSNHELIGDFVPCVRLADNKPGMYDTVSKSFFINQGTDEFIVP